VLLSAGEKFDLFVKQVDLAMAAGASGYMAGRAIFNEYFEQTPPEGPSKFLASTGVSRMKTLNAIVDAKAASWPDRYGISAKELAGTVDPSWYLEGKAKPAADQGPVKGDY
jgi:tagatose 1,6-diphosphate aldolase